MSDKTKLFLSDIIKQMIEDGFKFKPIKVLNIDWGTKEDWFDYARQYKTLFVDIDGTLVKSRVNILHHFGEKPRY